MVGSMKGLKPVSSPKANVLTEALKLLSAFGGGDDLNGLLEEMREVQSNNEAVLMDARELVVLVTAGQAELAKEKKAFESYKEETFEDLESSEKSLIAKQADFEQRNWKLAKRITEFDEREMKREQEFRIRVVNVAEKEQEQKATEDELDNELIKLQIEKNELSEAKQVLDNRESALRNIIG